MVKSKFMIIIFILLSGILVFYLSSGEVSFNAKSYDSNNNIIKNQDLEISNSIYLSQSLFRGEELLSFVMQSAAPITPHEQKVTFTAYVTNPFNSQATITKSELYKNNLLIESKSLSQQVNPKQKIQLTTSPINPSSDIIKNSFKMDITFTNQNKELKTIHYNFEYLYLTRCTADKDCNGLKCDIGNSARFSKTPNVFYCTKSCISHAQCSNGLICIKGVCG